MLAFCIRCKSKYAPSDEHPLYISNYQTCTIVEKRVKEKTFFFLSCEFLFWTDKMSFTVNLEVIKCHTTSVLKSHSS